MACAGCANSPHSSLTASPTLSSFFIARDQQTVAFCGYGRGPPKDALQWTISLNSNGMLRDGGYLLDNNDLLDSLELVTLDASSFQLNLLLSEPDATTYSTMRKAIERISVIAQPLLQNDRSCLVISILSR
jgi:hypothetical protein